MKKFSFLMAAFLFKWFPFLLLLSGGAPQPLPEPSRQDGPEPSHPFYVSVTEINHNQPENTIEISCKMFADDFENALKARHKANVDITHPKDRGQADKMVFEYVQKHIQLKINDKPVILEYVGYEKESEAVWCYLEVKNISRVRKLEVMNNLLYEMFNTQIGIVHASVGGHRKSTRLNFPETTAGFEW